MLDRYQHGVVERISPEAPVPVVRVVDQDFKIGGAGNVAQNAALLDGSPTLVSICGADGHGDELERLCRALRIDARLIHSTSRETTLKTRIMAAHQQMLRVDRETTRPLDAGESAALRKTVDDLGRVRNHRALGLRQGRRFRRISGLAARTRRRTENHP